MPAAVLGLLIAATAVLLNLSSSHEASQNRAQLITDTLWVKQAIQYQLERDAESLQNIANETGSQGLPLAAIRLRVDAYLRNVKEAAQVVLLDGEREVELIAVQDGEQPAGGTLGLPEEDSARIAALGAGAGAGTAARPQFGAVYRHASGPAVNLYAAARQDKRPHRLFVATFVFSRVLEQNVPWWFSQGNEVTLMDALDHMRQTRAVSGLGLGVYTHQTPIELPGVSLLLSTNSLTAAPSRVPNVLRVGIAALAALLILSLFALWRDIKQRERMEEKLHQEAAFSKAVGDSLVTGLRARDMEGRVTYVNPAFCKMVGLNADELVGRLPPMPYWAPEFALDYEQRMAAVYAGTVSPSAFETVFQRANGARFPVMIYEAPLKDARGVQTGWMSSIVDTSEQKAAQQAMRLQEERLQKVARLTTMGEIASSLAHELNQPLAAITSYLTGTLNLLERSNTNAGDLRMPLEKANQQAQRAGQVIRRVHDFVRKREPHRMAVHLSALVADCLPLVELQARNSGVRVSTHVPADLPAVMADPVLLEQVLLNLTRNAIEAMAGVPPPRRQLAISALAEGPDTVRLDVRDFGAGIPQETAEKLFLPFFTTKIEGMGMGLNICRSIVELHGGRLWFENHAEGTTFCLTLPVAADDLYHR
jgi:two-component system sensor histidine kinase DctS